MTSIASYKERLEGLELLHRGPAHVRRLREAGFASFEAQGYPTKRTEDWKYTPTTALEQTAWELPTSDDPGLTITTSGPSEYMVLLGETGLDAVEPVLGKVAFAGRAPFVALNDAFFGGGVIVRVPAGVKLEEPLRLDYRCDAKSAPREMFPRTVVMLGEGASATLIETWHGESGEHPYFVNAVTEIDLAPGAHLSHVTVQRHDRKRGHHVQTLAARVPGGAAYDTWGAWLGGALCRADVNVGLQGEGASCRVDGAYVAGDGQHIDVHSAIDHGKPHGTSRQLYKGVIGGDGHAVFNGKVLVREDAQKTDAEQANHNLLLSMDAEIDTKPQLEIFADDVKAAHGTTVGQVDDDQLFYLRSRGIPETQASRMITRAFLAEAFLELPREDLRDEVLETVQRDLDHLLEETT